MKIIKEKTMRSINAMEIGSDYINFAEASRALGISRHRLKKRCEQGQLPYHIFAERVCFLKTDIEKATGVTYLKDDFNMDDVLRELVQLFRENRRLRNEIDELEKFPGQPERHKPIPYTSDLINQATKLFD